MTSSGSESVYMTMIATPKPGLMDDLHKFILDAAEQHAEKEPDCLHWIAYKAMDPMKLLQGASGDEAAKGELVIQQEWRNIEGLIEHGKSEWATKLREQLVNLLSADIVMTVGKKFAGFERPKN